MTEIFKDNADTIRERATGDAVAFDGDDARHRLTEDPNSISGCGSGTLHTSTQTEAIAS